MKLKDLQNKVSQGLHRVVESIRVDRIPLPKGNRMVRAGAGFHDHKPFIRVDCGKEGTRISRRK